jgi:hypothetical protein
MTTKKQQTNFEKMCKEYVDKLSYGLVIWKYNDKSKSKIMCDTLIQPIKSSKEFIDKYTTNIKKNPYMFEITGKNKISKLFFDIDNVEIKKEDLKPLLIQLFNHIDTLINEPINHKQYYIYVKYNLYLDNVINSIHIIHYSKISYDCGNYLTQLLKDSNLNVLTDNMDTGLYNIHRQFCLPYNTKPYSNKKVYQNPLDSRKHIFTDYNICNDNVDKQQTKQILNVCISVIQSNLKEITIDIPQEYIEQTKKTNEIFVFNDNDNDLQKNREKTLLLNENNRQDIIDKVIEIINPNVFTKKYCSVWIVLTKNFKRLRLDKKCIEKFMKYSEECGDNENYTFENNMNYYNECSIENCIIDSYEMICRVLNKHNDIYYCFTNYIKCNVNDIIEYIYEKTNIDKSILKEKFVNIVENECDNKTIKIEDKSTYDIETGFLIVDNDIYNYNIERQHTQFHTKKDLDNELVIDNIDSDLLKKEIDSFVNRENDFISVKAKWGTGKSKYIVKPILNELFKQNENYYNHIDCVEDRYEKEELLESMCKVVMISPTNSLNKKEVSELKKMDYSNFYSHLEIQEIKAEANKSRDYEELNDIRKHFSIITSLESIDKAVDIYNTFHKDSYNTDRIDCLILDEVESIFNHFESGTFTKKNDSKSNVITTAYSQFQYFKNCCKIAKQIIILDCDISDRRLELLESIINEELDELVQNEYY